MVLVNGSKKKVNSLLRKSDRLAGVGSAVAAMHQRRYRGKHILEIIDSRAEKSIGYLKKALQIDPENIEALNNLAFGYSQIGKKKETLETMERALKIAPDNFQIKHNYVKALVYNGDCREALKVLDDMEEDFPEEKRKIVGERSDIYYEHLNQPYKAARLAEEFLKLLEDEQKSLE